MIEAAQHLRPGNHPTVGGPPKGGPAAGSITVDGLAENRKLKLDAWHRRGDKALAARRDPTHPAFASANRVITALLGPIAVEVP